MVHSKFKLIFRISLISVLLLLMILPLAVETANAQTTVNYFVTVNPTTPDSQMYTGIGVNWTFSYEALWSYGENSGTPIKNATVTIQVNDSENTTVDTLQLNTTSGIFSFNYSSSTPQKLTFTPTKLVTADGKEYNSKLLDQANDVYGFQSKSVVVWWDAFHISLVNYNADKSGTVYVSVNVTYLLIPESGLTLPASATYSNQTFLPNIAHNVNVTINGVKAQEISNGIYTANVSIWLPTAYIMVSVSQDGWIPTNAEFSFAQNANETVWINSISTGLGLFFAAIAIFFIFFHKSKDIISSKRKTFASLSGVMLILLSVISVYWGLVGLDSTLHGFDWLPLTLLGFLSFCVGSVAGYLSLRRKKQAFVIFAVILLMFTNLFGIKFSLDMYGLANPWLILIPSFALSIVSGILICNADEVFTN